MPETPRPYDSGDERALHDEPEAPPGSKPLVPKKRNLSKIAGLAAAGAAVFGAGYAERTREEVQPSYSVEQEYTSTREALRAEYEKTGNLPSVDTCTELILAHDLEAYTERAPEGAKVLGAELRTKYHELVAKVLQEALTPQQKPEAPLAALPRSHALEVLLRLKTVLQKNIGTTYNQESDTMVDPLLHGKYQCRSGTLSLVLMALEAEQKDRALFAGGEALVEIYTDGHVEPGLLLKDGTLIAVEMTSAGPAVRNFGKLPDIKSPMQVVRADHATYQDALDTSAHRDKAMILDNAPKGASTLPVGKKGNSRFGFGVPKVPEGDLPMSSVNVLPAEDTFNTERLFQQMEKVESDQELLENIVNPLEKKIVQDFLILRRTVNNYFQQHADILNPMLVRIQAKEKIPEKELQQAQDAINNLARDLEVYVVANNLDAQYDRANTILAKHDLKFQKATPIKIVWTLQHNALVLRDKWEKLPRK